MKNKKTFSIFLFCFTALSIFADSGIYVCGYFNRSRETTVPALKESGYTFGIIFNINVEENGDITYEGQTVCKNGVYVLANTSPHFADDLNSLLTGNTSILRLEYCIGGWTNYSYQKITNLVRSEGTGENSILYRNFKALKDAIPAVIAVNNDIEHEYEAETQAQFHVMLYDIGFKTTIAPYMNKQYWDSFVSKVQTARPGAVERNYLQCYGGGAGNNPKDWNISNLPIYGSHDLEANGFPRDEIIEKLTRWKNDAGIVGGFYWNYDTKRNLQAEAEPINEIFGGGEVAYREQRVAMFYPVKDYKAPQTDFSLGTYSASAIAEKGFIPGNLSAIKLKPGVKTTLYTGTDNTGESFVVTQDTPDISVVTGGKEIKSWTVAVNRIDELDGKDFLIKNKQSGYFLKPYSNMPTNGISIRQKENDNTDYMVWTFEAVENGLYKIINKGSRKTLQVSNSDIYEGTKLIQKLYSEDENQHFIVTGNGNSHRLIALNSLKYVGLADNEQNTSGGLIVQRSLSSDLSTDWLLIEPEVNKIENMELEKQYNVYPRIATDKIFIESNQFTSFNVKIADLNGRILIEQTQNSGSISVTVSSLQQGIYLLFVEAENCSIPYKIVKK